MVAVGRERQGEPGFTSYMVTQPFELGVERRLPASESDSECAVRIKLDEPSCDRLEARLVARLGCVTMSAGQIAAVRKCNGDLSRCARVQRGGNWDFIEENVQTGRAVE